MNTKKILLSLFAGVVGATVMSVSAMAADVTVTNDNELEVALGTATAGDTIILEAGEYQAFDLARHSEFNFKGMDGATVIASGSNSCYWPCFTGTVENIVFKAAEDYSYLYNYSAIIFAHDTNEGDPSDITFKNCDFISSNGNSGIHFVGDVDFYNCDFVGNDSYSAMNYCCPSGDGIVIDGCTFNGTYSFASIHLAEGAGADTTISDCKINTGLIEFGSPKNIVFSENVINSTINLWSENKVVLGNNEFGKDAKVSANSDKAVATILPTNTYVDGMTVEDIVVSEKDGSVEIPVAMIGEEYFLTFADAVKAAAESATESTPVTIQLAKGTFTESITLPSNISYVTFKGADNHATILKDSSIGHTGGTTDKKTNITFDGIIFENSNINLTAIYDKTKIENMTINNCKFLNIEGKAAVSINTNSLPNLVGFTFTNNVIDGVTGGSFSGLVLRAAPTGDIVITGNEISNVAWNAVQLVNLTADANVTITDNTMSSGASEGVLNIYNAKCGITIADNTINIVEGQKAVAGFAPVAKIGDKQFTTLAGAVADVKDNETIVLLKDIETTNIDNNGVAYTVDLNGFTLTPVGNEGDDKHYFNWGFDNLTIKNGVLNLNEAGASDSMFTFCNDDVLNIENVTIIREKYVDYTTYIMNMQTGYNNQVVNFIDSEIIIGDNACGYDFIINHSNTSAINFIRTNIECGNEFIVGYGGATFTDCIIDAPNAVLVWYANKPIVINGNSDVNVAYVVFNTGATLTVDDTSKLEAINIYCYDKTTGSGALVVGENATVHAENIDNAIINNPDSSIEGVVVSKADSVEVKFVKVDAEEVNGEMVDTKEGEDLYNINLVGSFEEIINRLNSADLTFKLTKNHDMDYEIIASNEEVAINPVNNSDNRYEFHYNGKNGVKTDVAEVITIGQVKFTGYGAYTFVVDEEANDTNIVHATTISDNKVDTFVPNDIADIQNGELVIEDVINAYIAVPTRNLIINIDFPNAIEEKDIAYNDMKVVVYGGDLATPITIDLGSDAVETDIDNNNDKETAKYFADFVDGKYVVTLTDILTVNNSYNVEVSGEGYRTARYTVTMNCDEFKTLNFWNNVKDNTVNVEEGKDSSAKNITFLAGDIVKDTVINIYDLSAVVSYFGEINLSANNKPEYVKYDLDRDGKIDSKDVAYVLVSWGK